MEQKDLQLLGSIIYDFCGLNYISNLSSLQLKVGKRLKALQIDNLAVYIVYLRNNPSEWDVLVETLTINETYFFREEKQLYTYQNDILPQFKKRDEPVRVWSAACASGEEAYTLSMIAHEAGFSLSDQLQIVATDIDKSVLNKAKMGVYPKNSLAFRRIEKKWIDKYFVEQEEMYEVCETLKNQISFNYTNLIQQAEIRSLGEFDIIFCRNVLIYFDENTIGKVIRSFYDALKPGGYLFLGHAESIIKYKNIGFETINQNGTFYHLKG